eukprot:EG_transcript_11985
MTAQVVAEAALDAAPVEDCSQSDLALRSCGAAQVSWQLTHWTRGATYATPNLQPLIQEVVNRPGWRAGGHLVLFLLPRFGRRRTFSVGSRCPPRLFVDSQEGGRQERSPDLPREAEDPTREAAESVAESGVEQLARSKGGEAEGEEGGDGAGEGEGVLDGTPRPPSSQAASSSRGPPSSWSVRPTEAAVAVSRPTHRLRIPILRGDDDGAESIAATGPVEQHASLALTPNHLVGLRFALPLPQGASVASAYLKLTAERPAVHPTTLSICVEVSGDAPPLAARPLAHRHTTPPVLWVLGLWHPGTRYRSPDLTAVLEAAVHHPDWRPGRHVLFLLTAAGGSRLASAFDGAPDRAARLHVKYFAAPTRLLGDLTHRLVALDLEEDEEEADEAAEEGGGGDQCSNPAHRSSVPSEASLNGRNRAPPSHSPATHPESATRRSIDA